MAIVGFVTQINELFLSIGKMPAFEQHKRPTT